MLRPNTPIPSVQDLTNNHARSLQEALAQAAISAGVVSPQMASDLVLARSNINVQSVVSAIGMHGLYQWLSKYIARQAVPIWATGVFLDGWLETYGMTRKQATPARGVVTGTGTAGAWLTAGTHLQTTSGVQYQVDADVQVDTNGAFSAAVTAVGSGLAGNTLSNVVLTLTSSVTGINATCQSIAGISGGTDTETDAQALYRLVQRLSYEPMGGAPHDYARWAMAVAGVTRAWGLRNPAGATSAGVMIVCDGNPNGLPSPQQIQDVYNYIRDPKRGPPDELFVFAPTLKPINPVIDLTPDSTATRAAALVELQDLFFRESQPGYALPHSHLIEAVSMATGEHTHKYMSPTLTSGEYFAATEFELVTLGEVTFV
ncbi:hypothetical protein DTO96_102145 [Ephemeroptericola cinctiostellae]|uniref:Uncharacterized protein n=1 Tax=Ephemeroptericola cinctiostellae TaxID=2268024 RepID=A0A345DDF3_9BURK|nr:baseplate J/gp47 family protein [Ephemeroptericola cinctiostellae]AXF86391.1 hypothetical protein DTO96_102145 [Ephemeroptericola cinctiostellae]